MLGTVTWTELLFELGTAADPLEEAEDEDAEEEDSLGRLALKDGGSDVGSD